MANPPNHFFKFIPPGFTFNLSIPKSFLRKLDGWRGKKAILRRGCHKWAVHITDRGVFGDGWKKFVVENGVEEFDIIVFDPSASERQYPNLPDNVKVSLTESDSLHTQERSKMLKRRMRTNYLSQSKAKRRRLDEDNCFVTIMTPYNITSSRMSVPLKFARANGLTTKKTNTQIVLVDEAKRTCQAKLYVKTDQIRLRGWRKLMRQNDLKVGDACMFKLVEDGEVPVFSFCNLGKKNTNDRVIKESRSTIKMKKTTDSNLGTQSYFILTMKPSYRNFGLYIPVEFSKSNDLKVGEMILRDDKCRSWNIQLKEKDKRYLSFGRGFKYFWDANGLKVGDDYKFVLVEKEKGRPPIMNVSYIGKNPTNKHIQSVVVNVDSSPYEIEDFPSYVGEVKSYCLERSMLYLPNKFALKHELFNKKQMLLKNMDEMSWTVDIKRNGHYCYIGRGWKEFCGENGLKEGNLFKLELVSNGEIPIAKFYVKNIH